MKKAIFIGFTIIGCAISIFKAEAHDVSYKNTKQLAQCAGLICLLQVKNLTDLISQNSLTGRISEHFDQGQLIDSLEVLKYIFPLETLAHKNTHGFMAPFNSKIYQHLMHAHCSFTAGCEVSRQDALRICDVCLLVSEKLNNALVFHTLPDDMVRRALVLKKFLTELLDHDSDCFVSTYIRS